AARRGDADSRRCGSRSWSPLKRERQETCCSPYDSRAGCARGDGKSACPEGAGRADIAEDDGCEGKNVDPCACQGGERTPKLRGGRCCAGPDTRRACWAN